MSKNTHSTVLYVSVAITIAAIVVSLTATIYYSRHLAEQRKDQQIAACERGNLLRNTVNDIILSSGVAVSQIAVVDCPATIK